MQCPASIVALPAGGIRVVSSLGAIGISYFLTPTLIPSNYRIDVIYQCFSLANIVIILNL